MMKKYFLLTIIFILLINTNVYSLKLLEPITKDLTYTNNADLGYFSADEFFMVSFLLEGNENYSLISVDPSQARDVIIEQTRKTQESIFAIIKLDERLSGEYSLKLLLISEKDTKEVILKMFITDEVIHTTLINYNPLVKYEKKETINLNILNKSNTTKKVRITSDLPVTWFSYKKERSPKEKEIILQPNSTTEQTYAYYPKEIGQREVNLEIKSIIETQGNIKVQENIDYYLTIETKKDLASIHGSKEHTYPLFNASLIPIYFFNKIIKII